MSSDHLDTPHARQLLAERARLLALKYTGHGVVELDEIDVVRLAAVRYELDRIESETEHGRRLERLLVDTAVQVVHLVTQRGQGYGSTRCCCEECGEYGLIAWGSGPNGHIWIDDPEVYGKLPPGYVACRRVPRRGR